MMIIFWKNSVYTRRQLSQDISYTNNRCVVVVVFVGKHFVETGEDDGEDGPSVLDVFHEYFHRAMDCLKENLNTDILLDVENKVYNRLMCPPHFLLYGSLCNMEVN